MIVNIDPLNIDELIAIPLMDTGIYFYADNFVKNESGFLNLKETTAFLQLQHLEQIALNWYHFSNLLPNLDSQRFFVCSEFELDHENEDIFTESLDWYRPRKTLLDWLTTLHLEDNEADRLFANIFLNYRQAITSHNVLEFCFAHGTLFPGVIIGNQVALNGEDTQATKRKPQGFVYLIGNKDVGILKIGYTTDVTQRLKALQTSCAFELKIIKTKKGTFDDERRLHDHHKQYRLKGEWFKWSDYIVDRF